MSSHNTLTSRLNLAGVLITLGIIYGEIGMLLMYVMKSILTSSHHFATCISRKKVEEIHMERE